MKLSLVARSSGFKNASLQWILLVPSLILHPLSPASRNHLQNTLSAPKSLSQFLVFGD